MALYIWFVDKFPCKNYPQQQQKKQPIKWLTCINLGMGRKVDGDKRFWLTCCNVKAYVVWTCIVIRLLALDKLSWLSSVINEGVVSFINFKTLCMGNIFSYHGLKGKNIRSGKYYFFCRILGIEFLLNFFFNYLWV